MSDFKPFAKAVHARLTAMSQHELFFVGEDSRELEVEYLRAFPEGTNPVYKQRTEHDCSCCKNFLRNFGRVVAVVDGKLQTVWDIPEGLPGPYDQVARSLREFVRSRPITGLFRTKEHRYGQERTKQLLDNGQVVNWDHFHGQVQAKHHSKTPDKHAGDYKTVVELFRRGLEELKPEDVQTVIGLIGDRMLYRGDEHLRAVTEFHQLQSKYLKLKPEERHQFVWANAGNPCARFRNTVIGTLVQDLSEGRDLEYAVKAFETKVAPTNYKRPSALVTPAMVNAAFSTIKDLGLELALERRHARLSDLSVQNVLWVDNQVKDMMKSELHTALLAQAVQKPKKFQVGEESNISIAEFETKVMPSAKTLELLVENHHVPNLMSLTAPVHAGEPRLFKWANDFGWSYNGNITDSIKEKVKAAGGNVTSAKLRVSLAWWNYDDLDIHVYPPNNRRIYFADKQGLLDVDMNAGRGHTRQPVENVSWKTVADGFYRLVVDQFNQRETSDVGCTIEIESSGKLYQLSYTKPLKKNTMMGELLVKNGVVEQILPGPDVEIGGLSREHWGVHTETYVPVQTVLLSPNFWDGQQIGNKHWFFLLQGCQNPLPARGIYNEFLNPKLEEHRKVFEILGDKSKCPPAEQQLSGMGFSSTRGDCVSVRVSNGQGTRVFNVTF